MRPERLKNEFLEMVEFTKDRNPESFFNIWQKRLGITNTEIREIFAKLTMQEVSVAPSPLPTLQKKTKPKAQIAQPKPSITDFWENFKSTFEKMFVS